MNIFKPSLTVFLLFIPILNAQEIKTTVTQNPKFEKLLNEKRKINNSIVINENYQVQIFNGDNETAKKTLTSFRRDFPNYDGTIIFKTPTYKVLVGNFKTRIEAEKNLIEIKKTYKNAVLIKPSK
ncbi:MAG: SPOR domain-containing protein [Flavobacterium sp.]